MRDDVLHNFFVMGLLFASLGIIITLIAQKLHFFRFKDLPRSSFKIKYSIWGFIGYLCVFFIAAPLIIRLLDPLLKEKVQFSPVILMTLLQTFAMVSVVTYLILFSFIQEKEALKRIWIHPKRFRFQCLLEDFGLGILTWIIAFPAVAFVSQFVEFITYLFTGTTGIDQIAIRYLKMASESPYALVIVLFAMIIAAPVIEEFIFRGLLFSYFKQKFGFNRALLLKGSQTSLCSLHFLCFLFTLVSSMKDKPL
jgi:uncharacterized protein